MKISSFFNNKRPVISFEVFPPKKDTPVESVYPMLERLAELHPDYISVTCGAGGTASDNTYEIAHTLKHCYDVEPLAHLTCINNSYEEVKASISKFKNANIENILALRGDKAANSKQTPYFTHAVDLVTCIRADNDLCIAGACYPEVHPTAQDTTSDIKYLKEKVDAGAEFLITQLFFDNEVFYKFCTDCRCAGINVPIEAGILPITSKNQIFRLATLCGASIPAEVSRMLCRYKDDDTALRCAGITYAINQCEDLIKHGVDGIHLYTMNDAGIAECIISGLKARNVL